MNRRSLLQLIPASLIVPQFEPVRAYSFVGGWNRTARERLHEACMSVFQMARGIQSLEVLEDEDISRPSIYLAVRATLLVGSKHIAMVVPEYVIDRITDDVLRADISMRCSTEYWIGNRT